MVKGLIFFDYDGTLVDERDDIYVPTKLTKAAIHAMQNKGWLCFLATGRALSYVPDTMRTLGLDGMVTSNGAVITLHDEIIYETYFSLAEIQNCLSEIAKWNLNTFLEGNHKCYVKDLKEAEYLHFMDYYKMNPQWFTELENKHYTDISKITYICPDEETRIKYGQMLSERYDMCYHRGCHTMDICQKGISKGSAIDYLCDYYQLDKQHCISFGDGDNDYELLAHAGYGIAMKKHHPSLDDVAFAITDTVLEEGIANALLRFGFLKEEELYEYGRA